MSSAPNTPWYREEFATADRLPARQVQPVSNPVQGEAGAHFTAIPQAELLALLRSGEQSACMAFGRIRAGLSAGLLTLAEPLLNRLITDEQGHEEAIARHSGRLPAVRAVDARTRRFFRSLESREPLVHLARVASLDACVCQVLTRVLGSSGSSWGRAGYALLFGIRADEGRHVRVSRALAQMLGADTSLVRRIDLEVRDRFAGLLCSRTAAFEALGIDMVRMSHAIRRDA